MIRVLFISAAISAAPVATTARSTPDAGLPVAIAVVEPSPDGGVARGPAAKHDSHVDTSETVRLRTELTALQQRVLALEQAVDRERQQNEQLRKLATQLEAQHDEQMAVLDAKQKSDKATADRAAQVHAALTGLVTAVHQLQTGDANIGWAIDAAQGAPMGPAAQKNLELARSALYNEDLSVTANYLVHAISEAQAFSAP